MDHLDQFLDFVYRVWCPLASHSATVLVKCFAVSSRRWVKKCSFGDINHFSEIRWRYLYVFFGYPVDSMMVLGALQWATTQHVTQCSEKDSALSQMSKLRLMAFVMPVTAIPCLLFSFAFEPGAFVANHLLHGELVNMTWRSERSLSKDRCCCLSDIYRLYRLRQVPSTTITRILWTTVSQNARISLFVAHIRPCI